MTGDTAADARGGFGLARMRPRDPAQVFRAASPLELFFDLIFVVAVSFSSAQLHHIEADGHLWSGVVAYLLTFFGIWWAWMNFTWFASAFDVDDWFYRVLTLTQMAGVLVLATGITAAMEEGDYRVLILGYVIMRLALVTQWLRASRSHPEMRRTALRYAAGVVICQALWIGFPWIPATVQIPAFLLLVLCELAVPVWAESASKTPWHSAHIADRYGSFTLIVLGESVLASTTAVVEVADGSHHLGQLVVTGFAGLVLAAGMWWLYFATEVTERLDHLRTALTFGYGHYFVFAAAGAFSAGITVLLSSQMGESALDPVTSAATLTVPIGIFVLGVWFLILRHNLEGATQVLVPLGALAIAACAFLPAPIVFAALVMAGLVVLVERHRVAH